MFSQIHKHINTPSTHIQTHTKVSITSKKYLSKRKKTIYYKKREKERNKQAKYEKKYMYYTHTERKTKAKKITKI
ncbi:hypothetical protein M5D96_006383, partial [Drosophila gunungcola]